MKQVFKFLVLPLLFMGILSCRAQMVQTVTDAKKLEINENQFIGKPLSDLFKEIKPEIKRVNVSPGGGETNSFFDFYFLSNEEYYKNRGEGKEPMGIRVYTKEIIPWYTSNRPKEDWRKWNSDDIKTYGNLTVVAIRVFGKN